jgi:putative transposase
MLIAHKIELDPTQAARKYFAQACGTDRFVWNWALAEWYRQYEAGQKPNAMALKKQFNAIKYQQFTWLEEIHRDAHAQPFANLGKAWNKFFADLKAGARMAPDNRMEKKRLKKMGVKLACKPTFKKKGKCIDSFYVANDKLHIVEDRIGLPKIGMVRMKETLRFGGRIMGATVSREAERWFVAIQVDVDVSMLAAKDRRERIGVDLNTGSIDLSNGETLAPPKPLKTLGRRLGRLQRKAAHKMEGAKVAAGIPKNEAMPKGTRLKASNNLAKLNKRLAKTHARISHMREDFLHKTTTRLCRENQAVTIENLCVQGMTASSRGDSATLGKKVRQKSGLNRSMLDVGFGEFRRQMKYKASMYGAELTMADRFFPSSQLCSTPGCGYRNKDLTLRDRSWTCPQCGTTHDRDRNAAKNLENFVPQAMREMTSVSAKADMSGSARTPRAETKP